ncbi:MAG: prolyl oligopeptidase family serine peptidase [Bacteroidota bacterium]
MNTLPLNRLTHVHQLAPLILMLCLVVTSTLPLHAQSKKEPLSFKDLTYWRNHVVTMSDNGAWYTKRYRLADAPKTRKDSSTKQAFEAYYQADNQTDVLYVCRTSGEVIYQVPDGRKPQFSAESDWIAYQIKPEPEKKKGKKDDKEDEKEQSFIELKHLESGFTVRYESGADYQFWENRNYFLTSDKNSLLIYDLDKRQEHYVGDIGEYLADKDANYIAYTIASEDQRGNGIYLYDPETMTTRALQTGRFTYSNLSWNQDHTALAAYRYPMADDKVDDPQVSLLAMSGIEAEPLKTVAYPAQKMTGLPEGMALAVRSEKASNDIVWSKDGDRFFLKFKAYSPTDTTKQKDSQERADTSTVQIWHWKDKKLLSERIMAHEDQQHETFEAIFVRQTNTLIPLTGEEIQDLIRSEGTDRWAIGTDNRAYISDWDVTRNDLYRIDLRTGAKTLMHANHASSWYSPNVDISPDGEQAVWWDGSHYVAYEFVTATERNISQTLPVSFVDQEYDEFGYVPSYGFVGWVKDQDAVLVNHKHDLWLLDLGDPSASKSLTASVTAHDSIRFRLEDDRFEDEANIEDRYIDLSSPLFLYAYNTQTKYAGFYQLQAGELKELIYEPASFYGPWRGYSILKSETSDAIIYVREDYQNYPEAYLTNRDFSKPKQLTQTNPQQEQFRWGERILIEYTNDDGVPLQGILSIPEGYQKGQKLPMMVYSYEKYSWRMYRHASPYLSGAVVPEMLYVSDGYLFLQPDIHFNIGTPHSDMHECINAAIETVIALGYVDEKRIGYEGFSFGGHCGMYISTQDNQFAAIAAGAGVSNLVQGFNLDIVRDGSNEQDYYMTSQGRLGTDPTSDTEMYIRESAVFNAQTMNTPLLLFHGTADKVVQWEHSFGFYNILRYLKKPVVFLSYKGEGHGLRKEGNRWDIQIRLKAFFDHYLKDEEAEPWMLEEMPYDPEAEPKGDDSRKLPDWK